MEDVCLVKGPSEVGLKELLGLCKMFWMFFSLDVFGCSWMFLDVFGCFF